MKSPGCAPWRHIFIPMASSAFGRTTLLTTNSARDSPVFAKVEAHIVDFHNPLQGRDSANTVYVAGMPLLQT
jgi:hypothetical protein